MKKRILIIVIVMALFTFCGCSLEKETDTLYQISTLQALIVGEYDGEVTADTLDNYGDIGLGTFDGLDGEMIVIDGKVYKARVDGTVEEVEKTEKIPFANVAYINSKEQTQIVFDDGYDGLKKQLNDFVEEGNIPVGFVVSGEFKNIEYRSVPEQEEPYPPLTDVVKDQTIFFEKNISGTLVGFRFPELLGGMNAVGYHLHFISDDRTKGGHLLNVDSGDVSVIGQELESFYVVFPENLKDINLEVDEEDVEAVEKKQD